MGGKQSLDGNGTKVDVSNLDKIFYPKAGFTKGDVIDCYVRVSEFLLPHLKQRPITLKRYPDGVEGFFFSEKKCPTHRPKWVKTTKVAKSEGGEINYCVINDLPSLIWAANLADLELHTFLHQAPSLNRPMSLAFDLDPGPPADVVLCGQVGLWLNDDKKTTVSVYSLLAKDYPTVWTPVTWEEVDAVVRKRDPGALSFQSKEVLKRVEKMGDLFAPVLSLKQKLPPLTVVQKLKKQS